MPSEGQLLQETSQNSPDALPSRELFLDRIKQSLEAARWRSNYLFAVLFIDLDRFKLKNDSFGHEIGDRLLIEIGRKVRKSLRAKDIVVQFRGDKYVILLEDIKYLSEVVHAAGRIQRELLSPIQLDQHEVFTSACIGIALSSKDYSRPENLLQDAETAMYRAKAQGPGRYEVFDTGMHEQAVDLLRLETGLRRAVDRRELRVHYQPIVSLETGQITAFEALVRWAHPERGLLYPAEFIPVAEEAGLIIPISEWVLKEACRQIAIWKNNFGARMSWTVSVNVTIEYLAKQGVVEEIITAISKDGVDARNVTLELTESQIMENAQFVSQVILDMRDSGLKVSIDDFGTGYSSLAYLASFSVHALKIDRSFISNVNSDQKKSAIVRTILSLGDNLGLEVIAEGVETKEELDHLRTMGCRYAQGHYISPPLDQDMVASFIQPLPQ